MNFITEVKKLNLVCSFYGEIQFQIRRTMNTRQRYELRLLAESGTFDIEAVAACFNVGERTIRYDVDAINDMLADEYFRDAVIVSQREAFIVDATDRWRIKSLISIGERDYTGSPLTTRERMLLIVFELCWHSDPITIRELADEYCVSKNTIARDIPKARAYCKSQNVELIGRRGKGIYIEGAEADRRRCLARVVHDYRDAAGLHSGLEIADYLKWFSEEELETIAEIVREAEHENALYLDDIAFEAMVVHIALSIERYKTNDRRELEQASPASSAVHDLQFEMADYIVKRINDAFSISLPKEEAAYIGVHIGARSSEALLSVENPDAVLGFMCIDAISMFSRKLGIDLTHDRHLYDRLLQHVAGSVFRKKAGLLLGNPLKDELTADYAEHMGIVREALKASGLAQLIDATDDEAAYVLLHFEAALVRSSSPRKASANVVVICSTGIGTAELLAAELKRSFDVNVIATIPAHQLDALKVDTSIDLAVSTVPLDTDLPCVVVRPILRQPDRDGISRLLQELGFGSDSESLSLAGLGNLARGIARILMRYPDEGVERELIQSIDEYLRASQVCIREGGRMLSDLLDGGHVVLDAHADTWEEAVRASGGPLVETGDITEEYIRAVIDNVNEAGPYVVITKGVALPHATNTIGVRRTSMSFVRLAHAVEFGSRENDPVEFLFMLATTDASSHVTALQSLAELLSTEGFTCFLRECSSADEIVERIRDFENSSDKTGQWRRWNV